MEGNGRRNMDGAITGDGERTEEEEDRHPPNVRSRQLFSRGCAYERPRFWSRDPVGRVLRLYHLCVEAADGESAGTGATTAKSWRGPTGVDGDPRPLPRPSLSHLPPLLHPCFTHSFPYSSFPLPSNTARRFGENMLDCPRNPANKRQSVAKVVGDQIHSVAIISTVGKDASHRSRMGTVASMNAA